MFTLTAIKLAVSGLLGGFRIPAFMKSPLFWKIAALILAGWFIWHKATTSADARWETKWANMTAVQDEKAATLGIEQQIGDEIRERQIKDIKNELAKKTLQLSALRKQKRNRLSESCNLCRVSRSRSPGGM